MASMRWKDTNSAPKVKGPIRCHTCRLKCLDAQHYLSHTCKPKVHLMLLRGAR